MQVELIEKDGFKYVSSRELARLLEKQHKHVLAKIRKNWLELWAGEGILFDRVGKKTNFALLSIDRAGSLLDRCQQNDLVVELGRELRQALAEQTNLDRMWEQVLPHIQPISTQILLRQQAVLVEFGDNNACIKMKSQSLLSMVKDKVANVEAAFSQVFNRQIAVKLLGLVGQSVKPQEKIENAWSATFVAGDRQTYSTPESTDLQPITATEPEAIEGGDTATVNGLSVFDFQSQSVRFLKIDGVDFVVGVDVARVLGYSDPSEAVSRIIDPAYKGVSKILTPGGLQVVACIDEAGIYQLIFNSKLPLAKEFQRWVFEQVLPSIRKTGSYSIVPESQQLPTQPQTQLQVLAQTAQAMAEFEQRQLTVNAKLESDLQAVKESVEAMRSGLEENLEQLKLDRNLAQDNLTQLPLASEAPPSVSVRNAISMLVRNYCFQSGRSHSEVWRELYTDMKYRYSYDAIARTDNHNRSNEKKRSYIDQCEIGGMLGELHKVTTSKLFPGSSSQK